jgi:hypothetical protein
VRYEFDLYVLHRRNYVFKELMDEYKERWKGNFIYIHKEMDG